MVSTVATRRGPTTRIEELAPELAPELGSASGSWDRPLAHAIESEWFAVDERGHVGVFDSRARGPVPDAASREWPTGSSFAYELVPLLGDADPEVLSYAAADLFAPSARSAARMFGYTRLDAPPSYDQTLHGVLAQLSLRPGARDRLAAAGLSLLPSREGGYAWGNPESPWLRDVWREGFVVAALLGHAIEWSRFEMFQFEHAGGITEAGDDDDLYLRLHAPRIPLRVHALPTSLRIRIGAARLVGVDFRTVDRVRVAAAAGPDER